MNTGASEIQIDGHIVLQWLRSRDIAESRKTLVGAGIDNGTSEQLLTISDLNDDMSLMCALNGETVRIPAALLKTYTVVECRDGHPLAAAIDDWMSDAQNESIRIKRQLKSASFRSAENLSDLDAKEALAMIADHRAGRLPDSAQQELRYNLLKSYGEHRLGASIMKTWCDLKLNSDHSVNGTDLIRLTYMRRHSGDLNNALLSTHVVATPDPKIRVSSEQRRILAIERAAILMDLFEVNFDPELLSQARKAANIANAIGGGGVDDTLGLYRRLKSLEDRSR